MGPVPYFPLRKNGDLLRPAINPNAEIHLFGQEVNPETWAVSKSDLFMKEPTGRDADNIAYGTVLSNDKHAGRSFDYLFANPPYGKDWKRDEDAVRAEHLGQRPIGCYSLRQISHLYGLPAAQRRATLDTMTCPS